jgi:hypothetical protein
MTHSYLKAISLGTTLMALSTGIPFIAQGQSQFSLPVVRA